MKLKDMTVRDVLRADYEKLLAWYIERERERRAEPDRPTGVSLKEHVAIDTAGALATQKWSDFSVDGKNFAGIVSDQEIELAVETRGNFMPWDTQEEVINRVKTLLAYQGFLLRETPPRRNFTYENQYGGLETYQSDTHVVGVYRDGIGGFVAVKVKPGRMGLEYSVDQWIGADEV